MAIAARRKNDLLKYHWYVEPAGQHDVHENTNAVIANYLASAGSATENFYSAMPDETGQLHQVWEVPYKLIICLDDVRRKGEPIEFNIYRRHEQAQFITLFPPLSWPYQGKSSLEKESRDKGVAETKRRLSEILKARQLSARKRALDALLKKVPKKG